MAQQLQQPQHQQRYGGPMTQHGQSGQQFGQQHQSQRQFGQEMGRRFDEAFSSEVRTTIHDLDRAASVAEWVKTQAAQRGMPTVVRVCDDIQDIAHLEKKLVIRQSPFAQPIGQASQQVLQQGLQELQQHIDEPEVQDAVEKTRRSLDSIDKGLMSLQTMGGQQQVGQQFGRQGGQRYQSQQYQQPQQQYQPQQGTQQQQYQPQQQTQTPRY